jgi:hypothetical protein
VGFEEGKALFGRQCGNAGKGGFSGCHILGSPFKRRIVQTNSVNGANPASQHHVQALHKPRRHRESFVRPLDGIGLRAGCCASGSHASGEFDRIPPLLFHLLDRACRLKHADRCCGSGPDGGSSRASRSHARSNLPCRSRSLYSSSTCSLILRSINSVLQKDRELRSPIGFAQTSIVEESCLYFIRAGWLRL